MADERFPISFGALRPLFVALGLLPRLSHVERRGDELWVRMSWAFSSHFPVAAIASIAPYTRIVGGIGVHGFGGRDHFAAKQPNGPIHTYDALYYDIVPDQRIIYSYEMYADDTRISVSIATVELTPVGAGTRLTFTEQGSYLDGMDTPEQREHGTGEVLDDFGRTLRAMRA
jgi:Activator of Hsp90 ATPase homolog 1-like protein